METISNTNRSMSIFPKHVRLTLTLAGIVIAIICSLALLQDLYPSTYIQAGIPKIMEATKIAPGSLHIEMSGMNLVSSLWPF